jgi:serine/threonine-protein kinase HipA
MPYQQVDLIEVLAWGRRVAAIALDPSTGFYGFEYAPEWLQGSIELAPLKMPNRNGVYQFTDLPPETYYRLPAMIADSLPDAFGNALVNASLAGMGVSESQITPLGRLAYAADRAMGALTFKPPVMPQKEISTALQLADLVTAARATISGNFNNGDTLVDSLRQLIQVGTSAGGARAKAVIAYNKSTGQIRSGQFDPPEGFEHWLIKLDGIDGSMEGQKDRLEGSHQYGRIEYAYYLMAAAAGIEMSECQLLSEGPRTHFLTKRFDRGPQGQRIHLQSLCAVAHLDYKMRDTHSYSQYFLTVSQLGLGPDALAQAFRRMVFNVAAVNRDDHTKNVAFLLPERGHWQLAPAFDVIHSYKPSGEWTQRHQMSVNGKFENITQADIEQVGNLHGVPAYRQIISQVLAAVAGWKQYAQLSGLSTDVTQAITDDIETFNPR